MPHLTINGVSFHYDDTGGPDPAIVFSHGLLMSSRMFAAQIAAFNDRQYELLVTGTLVVE